MASIALGALAMVIALGVALFWGVRLVILKLLRGR